MCYIIFSFVLVRQNVGEKQVGTAKTALGCVIHMEPTPSIYILEQLTLKGCLPHSLNRFYQVLKLRTLPQHFSRLSPHPLGCSKTLLYTADNCVLARWPAHTGVRFRPRGRGGSADISLPDKMRTGKGETSVSVR